MPSDTIEVPDFKGLTLTKAHRKALDTPVVLSYFDQGGRPISAPAEGQWSNWMVTQNMPPTLPGTEINSGGQVGVIIVFVPWT